MIEVQIPMILITREITISFEIVFVVFQKYRV